MFSKPSILNRNDNNLNKDGRSLSSINSPSASLSNQMPPATPTPVAQPEVTPILSPVAATSNEPVIDARLIVGPDVKLKALFANHVANLTGYPPRIRECKAGTSLVMSTSNARESPHSRAKGRTPTRFAKRAFRKPVLAATTVPL